MDIIGVDVGGTFTDLIRFDEGSGQITAVKVPSTPRNPAQAILAGLAKFGLDPTNVRHIIHGTTVATNAILERKGSKVGLVATAGFRDAIEIGSTRRMVEGGMFNPRFVRPAPLVPRPLRFEVRERLLYDGRVQVPLQEEDLATVARQLADSGAEAVAVCFLHSYRNPEHELQAGAALRKSLPGVFFCLSAEVVPEYREFERFSTAVLNAYVSPVMGHYLASLDHELESHGYTAPVFTMASNGGIATSERASKLAVLTVLSGPVGGVNGSIAVARAAGFRNLITYDMGGTSTDVCLVHDLEPLVTTENVVASFPLKMPQVDINTVGAGGGSIAWLDGSELKVGPRSAGADPGPAAYGKGGTETTVSDANLFLGRIDPDRVLGDAIHLHPLQAEEALKGLAEQLGGLDLHRLADGVVRLAVARMTASIREISVQRGYDPRDFVLVAFGGAGPMHATQVAEELGTTRVLIPRLPGNLSAFGLLTSDLRRDHVRTYLATLSAMRADDLAAAFEELEDVGHRQLIAEGVAGDDIYVMPSLDMRYLGQAYELNVPLPADGCDLDAIRRAFNASYLATYGRVSEDQEIEVVNLRSAAFGRVLKPPLQPLARISDSGEASLGVRPVYFGARFWDTPFYERDRLPIGAHLKGPAIIEESGATTVVEPGWDIEVDAFGNLLLGSLHVPKEPGMQESETQVDPITLEVAHEGLIAIVREMRANMIRTAYSSIIYEGQDFSCCILDARGQLIAKAPADNPSHIFPVPWSVRTVLEHFGEDVQPGDVFLHNDPYTGGTHLNDVATIYPVFLEGQLSAFTVVRAHWADVGGMTPGSISGQATEIYQEGLRIPPIRVYDRGEANRAALDIIFANARGERERRGDFTATLVSCRQAGAKLEAMASKLGPDNLRTCMVKFLERSERRMRELIRSMDAGTYAYEAYVESTGRELEPLRATLALTVRDAELTADFAGSSPQGPGPMNSGPAMASTTVFTIAKSYLDPTTAVNQGASRPLHVQVPEGTFLNARHPAACGGMSEIRRALESAVMGVLATAIPESGTGDNKGAANHVYIGGRNARGEQFIFYEYPAGGTGAFHGCDGNNAVRYFTEGDFSSIQPVEAIENEHPLLVERCEIRGDSAGAGRWRGGFGLRRDLRALADRSVMSVLSDRNILKPHGVYGGEAGASNRFTVLRGVEEIEPSTIPGKVSGFGLQRGDVVIVRTAGGGGSGDPLERPADRVWQDVYYGYLSDVAARERYGVVIASGGVDQGVTSALRAELRRQRVFVTLASWEGTEYEAARRVLPLARTIAARADVAEDDVVELVNPHGAPLRAWARLVDETGDRAYMGPTGLRILGAQPGDRFYLRRLGPWAPPSRET